MSKTQVSRIFQISRNTIDLWLKKREKTGDYREEISDRTIGKALKKIL